MWSRFFFGVTLCAAFLFTGRILRVRRTRVVWVAGAAVTLAVITEQSGYPHYWSPIAPVILLFIVEGFRHLAQCRLGSAKIGPAIVRAVVPLFCVLVVVQTATKSPSTPPDSSANFFSWCCTEVRMKDREPLVRQLQAIPGNHLVIVAYELGNYDTSEWVYNEPDIDSTRIVFAQDMGPDKNQELIHYYPRRRVWRALVKKDQVATLEPLNVR